MNNYVVYDFPADDNFEFTKLISKYSAESYNTYGCLNKYKNKLFRMFYYFFIMFKLFRKRKRISNLIFWQQILGIFYVLICLISNTKKYNKITIMTFIYKPKKGVVGKIYEIMIKKVLNSKYVDKVICFSKYECEYYKEYFKLNKDIFNFCKYGVKDENVKSVRNKDIVILDIGYSNRDHDFTIAVFKNQNYKVKIIDYTYLKNNLFENVEICHNINYGEELYREIRNAFLIFVPLNDINISSGQTVFIQAMMFGKPIIVTKTNTLDDYIIDGNNGFIVEKNKRDVLEKTELLINDKVLYKQMSEFSRKLYEKEYSWDAMAKSISNLIS